MARILKYVGFKNEKLKRLTNYYVSGHFPSSCYYLKHRPVYISKWNVSETGFCLRFQVKPVQLGPVDTASPYLPEDGDRIQ
jgi:hypothetical protein